MPTPTPPSPVVPTRRSVFSALVRIFVFVLVLVLIGLFGWSEYQRRVTSRQLQETVAQLDEIRASSQESSTSAADAVLQRISELIDISLEPRPTVATINDIDRLREANEFFGAAENGDYLVLTGNRAILYDADRDIVLDVAPFRINRLEPSGSPGVGEEGGEISPSPEAPTSSSFISPSL